MKKKLGLKIYWVATVGPKWQIVLPKESREDLSINVWGEYELAMIDKKMFALWIKKDYEKSKSYIAFVKSFASIEKLWFIKIWTKYQFVIPNLVRKELTIKTWDNLLILWKSSEWLGFIKNDNMDFLFEYLKRNV